MEVRSFVPFYFLVIQKGWLSRYLRDLSSKTKPFVIKRAERHELGSVKDYPNFRQKGSPWLTKDYALLKQSVEELALDPAKDIGKGLVAQLRSEVFDERRGLREIAQALRRLQLS